MRYQNQLTGSELELSNNLGFAIREVMSGLPVAQQLYAAVMCVAHIIHSDFLDADDRRTGCYEPSIQTRTGADI